MHMIAVQKWIVWCWQLLYLWS